MNKFVNINTKNGSATIIARNSVAYDSKEFSDLMSSQGIEIDAGRNVTVAELFAKAKANSNK